jgi:hypothetical protein
MPVRIIWGVGRRGRSLGACECAGVEHSSLTWLDDSSIRVFLCPDRLTTLQLADGMPHLGVSFRFRVNLALAIDARG